MISTERTAYELPTWAPLPARADPGFDELAARVARELEVLRVLVVLTSKSGQVYPGAHGLPEPWNSRRSMPLSQSMSVQVAGDGRPMVVRDAREHAEFRDRFAVREMSVVGFVAMPLLDVYGHPVGVLSVADDRPRDWTPEELTTLRRRAGEASALLRVRALDLAEEEASAAARRSCAAAQQAAAEAAAALVQAEAAADRARVVARLSQELLPAETVLDVLRSVDQFLRSPLGADRALVGLVESGSTELQVWATVAGDQPPARRATGLRVEDAHPLAVAVRERRVVPAVDRGTSVSVPILLGHHTSVGGLLVGWASGRVVDDPLRAVVGDLARHVGHALDRVLLHDQRLRTLG